MENKMIPVSDPAPVEAEPAQADNLVLKFTRPYNFEGQTITEVDLGGLEDVSAQDMVAADKYINRSGSVSAVPEMSLAYACFIASRITRLPIEFYMGLKSKDAIRLKNTVTNFFFADE